MKPHILYRDKIITPDDKILAAHDAQLGAIQEIHAAVLSTLGQKPRENSMRNRALPRPEDTLAEGRVVLEPLYPGVHTLPQTIADLANRMQRSRRTLKDGGSTHPMGRYHSSATINGMISPDQEFNQLFTNSMEETCKAGRLVLMPRGLTVYPYAYDKVALLVVRPFYACDDQYFNEEEMRIYRQFYGETLD